MKALSLEFKVGVFVFVSVLLLSMIVFQIGGVNILGANMYKLNVIFDFVGGVSKDAPVHVSGVAVGDVKDVKISYDTVKKKTQVILVLMINKNVKIPIDSVAYINTLGILGEKYVEIVSGESRDKFLEEGDSLTGNNPVQLEKLTESLVDVVGDQTVRDSLKESFYNLRVATDNLRQASELLNDTIAGVKNGQGTIGKLLTDDSIYNQTEAMVVNLNTKLDKTITDLNISLNDLVSDLKTHPWKLFQRPKPDKKTKPRKTNDVNYNFN
ncbi:MAG: MCE family protein [Candidatus Omnitrophica bacterium]|nr:MCE family protein [Candidatus Omnitrophota bacterium]